MQKYIKYNELRELKIAGTLPFRKYWLSYKTWTLVQDTKNSSWQLTLSFTNEYENTLCS